ncbi:MAG: hypothetical protein [Malazfec virus 1]
MENMISRKRLSKPSGLLVSKLQFEKVKIKK